ncbi:MULTISPECIES: XkdW family protein [Pseudomonas]|uniref:XkdW protein n=1 Tax=Pseudomonas lutea TaxID=243924 RepID=A0A9X8QLP4_9PSED|nr:MULTISPECIES: XkdW family protein [Pseudomonas]SER35838.1 XkdW protein [Pseudomonas lutea]
MTLHEILVALFPAANPKTSWQLRNDADDRGDYISEWALEGVPQPTVAELSEAAATLPLKLAIDAKVAELTAACAAAITGGFTCDALGAVYTYPSLVEDQLNLTGSIQLSQLEDGQSEDWTTPFKCANSSGEWDAVAHTAAQIQKVGVRFTKIKLTYIGTKDALVKKAKAATTLEDVSAIVWQTPAV